MKLKPSKMQVCIQKGLGKIYDLSPEPGKMMYFVKVLFSFFSSCFGEACHEGKGGIQDYSASTVKTYIKHVSLGNIFPCV